MEVLNFIFRLGVVFAIFGFLWGMIDIGLRLLTASRPRTMVESYIIKGIKYLLLADVTFLFCLGDLDKHMIVSYQVVLGGIVLLMYFVGKLQNSQNQAAVFKMMGRNIPQAPRLSFNMKAEIGVICGALALFAVLWFYPWLATNAASKWFHGSILSIEDAFFFGFIFKVIGFFFILNVLFKLVGGLTFILNGGKTPAPNNGIDGSDESNNDDFDDFEEVD
ncbi:MAG: hypothetical protein P8P74_07410 [Crocinitomicaceae bacterium]|nr:hypothetical protein [Crocinitomicaceae bacterium]